MTNCIITTSANTQSEAICRIESMLYRANLEDSIVESKLESKQDGGRFHDTFRFIFKIDASPENIADAFNNTSVGVTFLKEELSQESNEDFDETFNNESDEDFSKSSSNKLNEESDDKNTDTSSKTSNASMMFNIDNIIDEALAEVNIVKIITDKIKLAVNKAIDEFCQSDKLKIAIKEKIEQSLNKF